MIKSLLDADENPPPETRVVIEETTIVPPVANVKDDNIFTTEQIAEIEDILEIPGASASGDAQIHASERQANAPISPAPVETANFQSAETFAEQSNAFGETTQTKSDESPLFQTAFEPESTAETMRKSGLAYAAAITLFGAVVFMMILGWGADLLFGSAPWGIVGGIVLGAIIGFVQFFRLTSQIIKNRE